MKRKWEALIGVSLALLLLSPLLLFWASLLRIKYRPLPPIARGNVRYLVSDEGTGKDDWRTFYSWNDGRYGWRLSESGRIVFDAPDAKNREVARKSERAARAKQLKLRSDGFLWAWDAKRSLIWHSKGGQLWQGQQIIGTCRNRIAAYSGWPVYDFRLDFFGAQGKIIGNGRIATAPASSGGASEPHGRLFPLFWDGKSEMPHDLNEFIDEKNGVILFRALATNAKGQILCLGQKTDARGAETPDWKNLRRLILTPHDSNPPN